VEVAWKYVSISRGEAFPDRLQGCYSEKVHALVRSIFGSRVITNRMQVGNFVTDDALSGM
jgi:hypothetical protein